MNDHIDDLYDRLASIQADAQFGMKATERFWGELGDDVSPDAIEDAYSALARIKDIAREAMRALGPLSPPR